MSINKIEQEALTINNTGELANIFNSYFAAVGNKLAAQMDWEGAPHVETGNDCSMYCYLTTEDEISQIIRNLKDGAPGYDEIPAKILKSAHSVLAKLILHLVNLLLRYGQFHRL